MVTVLSWRTMGCSIKSSFEERVDLICNPYEPTFEVTRKPPKRLYFRFFMLQVKRLFHEQTGASIFTNRTKQNRHAFAQHNPCGVDRARETLQTPECNLLQCTSGTTLHYTTPSVSSPSPVAPGNCMCLLLSSSFMFSSRFTSHVPIKSKGLLLPYPIYCLLPAMVTWCS